MPPTPFRLPYMQGAVAKSHTVRCGEDLNALTEGVRKSVAHAIEIWQGRRLVARVKLGNAKFRRQALSVKSRENRPEDAERTDVNGTWFRPYDSD